MAVTLMSAHCLRNTPSMKFVKLRRRRGHCYVFISCHKLVRYVVDFARNEFLFTVHSRKLFLFQFCLILTVIQLVFSKAYQSLKCFICFGFLNDGALSTVSVVFKRLTLL